MDIYQKYYQDTLNQKIKKKTTNEARFYISSREDTPKQILKSIRSHWAIE
ncbi:MAG: hypothetical protein HW390_2397, partial [Candidatus Brocadiaceae bacterium]|nr:hypothetical protein [Candidatus Brocadiaceae bacterium]